MITSLFKIHWKEHLQTCKLAYPMIASEFIFGLDPFINTLFSAKLGPFDLAAQSLISLLFFTLCGIIWGILSSVCILTSHHFGAKKYAEIRQIFYSGLLLSLLLAIFSGIILWSAPYLFIHMHENLQVVNLSIGYAHILPLTILGIAIYALFAEILIATSKTGFILVLSIIETPLNVLLKYLLVFGKCGFPALGLAGLGWALGIVIWGTIALMVLYIVLHPTLRSLKLLHLEKFNKNFFARQYFGIKRLFLLGIPTGIDYLSQNGIFLVMGLLMGCISSYALAANQITFQFVLFFAIIIWGGIGQPTMSRIGQILGAGKISYVKTIVLTNIQHSLFFIAPILVIFIFYPELLIRIDLNIHHPSNFFLFTLSKQFMRISSIYLLLSCINTVLESALRAYKDTYAPLKINFIGFWLVGLSIGYFLAFPLNLGPFGLWLGLIVGTLISNLLMIRRFLIMQVKNNH